VPAAADALAGSMTMTEREHCGQWQPHAIIPIPRRERANGDG
jgi:hypothetical protein